ncbi:hypothetical protein PHYSODRAFT_257960 [Phytophthora sojae]|uniref:Uncharacterized protein n=1 Tax=Phytophthora sojae (strain P6497) TaxID=1094619 RepID=G4YRL6_PHYSP|nr:hypothetical protein PHYSODRAFT_257960 [Phytophthora sojae]EGZ23481.1 hypothetical protein PHYSODRAFT_257960 [Phytophthora sojae]|eukprot:XP_009518769.1 hypothetical protein PHYSODRAFT_257960 [Phytophthora sojae]
MTWANAQSKPAPPDRSMSTWSMHYFEQQKQLKCQQKLTSKLRPAAIGAGVAVFGRIVLMPVMLMSVFGLTGYLSDGTFLIEYKDSYFAYSQMDLVMSGGCTPCHTYCKRVLLQMNTFNHEALMSKPTFEDLYTATSWDYDLLSSEALALAERLEASGAICSGGVDEWGSPLSIITGTAAEVVEIIETLNLSVTPLELAEAKKGIETKDECITKWAVEGHLRLFMFQAVKNSIDYSSIPAADFNVYPEYADCRPPVNNAGIIGEKLALSTAGEDLVSVVPDILKLFPYSFDSSLPVISRMLATTSPTIYHVAAVNQSLFRGYYGGCRVRTVNTTGVYIEDTCTINKHWQNYGLMLQAPDDIPACTTGSDSICIHNYYNSLWEWVTGTDSTPGRALMKISVFRNRYADTVALSVLPGMVMVQMLLMGVISLYQIMSHKRSVLLTQIWAYRCQNGRMQVLYLAQITYHLIYNSDLYYVGLVTGTLTVESVANLTFGFFIFSYSFINLAKARSGEQQLDRYFRLTWEIMQIFITTCVAALLYSIRSTSLSWIVDYNGQLLRKTTTLGKKYCGLHDSCFLMHVNLAVVVAVISTALGLVALSASFFAQKRYGKRLAVRRQSSYSSATKVASLAKGANRYIIHNSKSASLSRKEKMEVVDELPPPPLTTFEEHCLGSPFTRLFKDCDDFACMQYMGKRCTSVEALLLTGYLFYGQHVYQAGSVVLLLLARLIPRKLLRTFNVLLIRWYMDPDHGTLTHALSCTWFKASEENYRISEATPVA